MSCSRLWSAICTRTPTKEKAKSRSAKVAQRDSWLIPQPQMRAASRNMQRQPLLALLHTMRTLPPAAELTDKGTAPRRCSMINLLLVVVESWPKCRPRAQRTRLRRAFRLQIWRLPVPPQRRPAPARNRNQATVRRAGGVNGRSHTKAPSTWLRPCRCTLPSPLSCLRPCLGTCRIPTASCRQCSRCMSRMHARDARTDP